MKYYTKKEMSEKYGVPEVTIDTWRERGVLKSHKGPNTNDRVYITEEDWLEVPAFMRQRYEK